MSMEFPLGTVIQYKAGSGWGNWTVVEVINDACKIQLTSFDRPIEFRPIGYEVWLDISRIQSHIRGGFVISVFPSSSIAEILT